MIRFQERVVDLYSAPAASLGSRLPHFIAWLDSEPYFRETLASLPEIGVGGEEWIRENVRRNSVVFPSEESATVGCCLLVTRHIAALDDPSDSMYMVAHEFSSAHDRESGCRAFLGVFIDPLVSWLKERILIDDHLLHSLQRYAREAAWFRRDELREEYERDSSKGEATLDWDLRHHLFRDGIDFPLSQVHGPSGRPDVVVPDDEAEPLPLEIKVFDPPSGRTKDDVRAGFVQATEYARDYGRADGYLAVFDATDVGLAIHGDDPKSHPPSIRSSGITVFIVVIAIGRTQAASKRKTTRTTLDAAFFTEAARN